MKTDENGLFIALKYGAVAMAGAMTHQIFMKQSEAERDNAAYEKGYTDYRKLIEQQIGLPIVQKDVESLN